MAAWPPLSLLILATAAGLEYPNCTYKSCPVCFEPRTLRNLTLALPGEVVRSPLRLMQSSNSLMSLWTLVSQAVGILAQEKLGIQVEYVDCWGLADCLRRTLSCKGAGRLGPCVRDLHFWGVPWDESGQGPKGTRVDQFVSLGPVGWYDEPGLYVVKGRNVELAWRAARVVLTFYASFTGRRPLARPFLIPPASLSKAEHCPGPNATSLYHLAFARDGYVCRGGWWLTPACAALGPQWKVGCMAVLWELTFFAGPTGSMLRTLVDSSMVVAVRRRTFHPHDLVRCRAGPCFVLLTTGLVALERRASWALKLVALPPVVDTTDNLLLAMKWGWKPAVVANEALGTLLRQLQVVPAVAGSMIDMYQRASVPVKDKASPKTFQKTMCDWLRGHEPSWSPWLPTSLACMPGDVFSQDTQACQPCPGGTFFSDDFPPLRCRRCPRGRYSEEVRSMECTRCTAGFHQPDEGRQSCRPCRQGFYQDMPGESACRACPGGLTTRRVGAPGVATCACPERTYPTLARGCKACPGGMSCSGSSAEQLPGHFAEVIDAGVPTFSVYRCRSAEECPAGPPSTCAPGRMGLACAGCLPWHVEARGGTCWPCEQWDRVGLGAALACVAAAATSLPPLVARLSISTQSRVMVTVLATGGQVAGAVQALTAFQHLRVAWSGACRPLMAAFRIASLDFEVLGVSCLTTVGASAVSLVAALGLYPCSLVFMLAGCALSQLAAQRVSWRQFCNLNGALLYSVFIGLTVAVLRPLHCRNNPNGQETMASDPQVRCWEQGAHTPLVALSAVGIMVYPVTLLALALWQTLTYPSHVAAGRGLEVHEKYDFLFGRFRMERYYYGCVILLRNILVSLAPVCLVDQGALPLAIIAAVMLATTSFSAAWWPWRTPMANVSEVCICISFVLLVLSTVPLIETSGEDRSLELVLFLTFVAMLAAGFLVVVHSAVLRLRGPGAFHAFLCHDQACSGVLCRLLKMTIQSRSACRVFLEADSLHDLDLILDTVRCSTRNLVVVLSPRLLCRAWRAGEIATAHANGVPLVPVACSGFQAPDSILPEELVGAWTDEEAHELLRFGITAAQIQEACGRLLELERLALPPPGSGPEHDKAVEALLGRCGLRSGCLSALLQAGPSETKADARICVSGHCADAEAVCTCRVMQAMLRRDMQQDVQVACSLEELGAAAEHVSRWVVLLTRGLLETPEFAEMLLRLAESRQSLSIITVVADPGFEFPGDDFYLDLEANGLGRPGLGSGEGARLSGAYRALMKVLAKPLSPLGSEGLLQRQVYEICYRIRS